MIALVVIIVVLLILAGITIQLVLSNGGIFNQAQNAKEQTRIGELLDKFNMSEAVLAAEKLGKTTLEEYIKQIQEKEGYIIEAEEQDDGSYNVTTEDGYVFNVSIIEGTDTNDIVIEYIGQAGNLPPVVKVKDITTNSATIELSRIDGITSYKYEYKKHDESEYKETTGNNNICTFTGLTNNTIYDVKVTVIKDGQEIVIEKQIAVGKIQTGGVIKLKSVTWANNKATAVVYHEESASYRIEWQLMGSTIWNQGEIGVKEISIPNLNHNDTILLRLNDGTSSGSDASVSIIDTIAPQPAIISFNPETAQTGTNITATVVMQDNESGINNSQSRYEFNKSSESLGIEDENLYTGGTFTSTTAITIKGTTGTWYLHVLSVDNAGNKVETVSNAITITQAEIASLDRSQGDIEIAFVDMANNPISSSNVPTPKLGTGMTPIKWSGSTVVTTTAEDPEWYDYSQKKWANAQTADGSMWVWIPRYSYKILYKDTSGNVIGYSDSDGITDINGNIVTGTKKSGAVEVTGTLDGKTIEKYVLHPAFTTNSNNGGWSSDIPGIWVAKFEASSVEGNSNGIGDNVTTKTIQVKPGVASWRYIQVSNIYTNCLNYNSALQSHMMKNSEWGACAYLSKSVYGINGEITINNGSLYYTGGGTAYVINTAQSTTGNVYGIYDMSGGSWEYVASYVDNGNGSLTTYGSSLVSGATNMKQVYSKESTDDRELNYQANSSRYGDAVYETSTAGTGSTSWYGAYSSFPYSDGPFFIRGGYRSGSRAGAFAFYYYYGDYDGGGSHSFRPVLVAP